MINNLDKQLTRYLLEIAKKVSTTDHFAEEYAISLDTVKNLERVADLSTSLVGIYQTIFNNRESMSDAARQDLNTMYDHVKIMLDQALKMFETDDMQDFIVLAENNRALHQMDMKYRERHFKRMAQGTCDSNYASSLFIDILTTLVRIGGHAVNISEYVYGGLLKDVTLEVSQ